MLAVVLHLPPFLTDYFATTSFVEMAAHALLAVGWIPIFGIMIWGFTELWVDHKQGQWDAHTHWVLLRIQIPAGAINTPKGMENFFNNIAGSKSAITWKEAHLLGKFQAYFSFEIVSLEGEVRYYIRTPDKYQDLVEAALYAQYPEAQISEEEDYVGIIPDDYPNDKSKVFGSEMKLAKPAYYPIRTYLSFEHQGEKDARFKDPLLNLIEFMGKMGKGESFFLQIVIMQPDEQAWAKEGEKYLMKLMGKEEKHTPGMGAQIFGSLASLPSEALRQATGMELGGGGEHAPTADDFRMFKMTPSEREVADAIAMKISKLGWHTKIRIFYLGPNDHFRKPLMAAAIKGTFHPFAHLGMNKFSMHDPATPKDDYFWLIWQINARMKRLVSRYKNRSLSAGTAPFILNSEELASLFHFPASDARTPILAASGARRAEAPFALPLAPEDAPNFVNWKDKAPEVEVAHAPQVPVEFAVPTPHASREAAEQPITARHPAPQFTPQPGKPAPLPPGLTVESADVAGDDAVPPNLPV